ncbi:MAG: DUF4831 family protein [Paludibacteraceae bacterium]|nr:DUF4831 family protein [Paludibacteraceae bacterium]
MNKLFLSALALYATAATAQNAVVSVKDKETNSKDEVVASYYLPKTVFEIEVEAVNNQFKAGPYAADAKRYFGTAADMQDRDSWEIKNIRIKPKAEPDPAQHYKVYAAFGSTGSLVSLTDKGILRGVNIPMTMAMGGGAEKNDMHNKFSQDRGNGRGHHNGKAFKTQKSEFKTNFKYKENDSVPEISNAQFAYDLINNLRMAKADMLQQNGDDVKDIKAFLNSIDNEEQELNELFYGKTNKVPQRMTFSFSPDKEGNNQEVCKFSARNGFGESSEAISISIKKKYATNKVSNTSGKTGYVYRVPALADVEIKQGKNTLWKGTLEIAQLGSTENLPAGFFEKNDLKALFDKETGALLQISK